MDLSHFPQRKSQIHHGNVSFSLVSLQNRKHDAVFKPWTTENSWGIVLLFWEKSHHFSSVSSQIPCFFPAYLLFSTLSLHHHLNVSFVVILKFFWNIPLSASCLNIAACLPWASWINSIGSAVLICSLALSSLSWCRNCHLSCLLHLI